MKKIKLFSLFLAFLVHLPIQAAPLSWKKMEPGLEQGQNTQLLLYKIDLKRYKLKLLMDQDLGQSGASVRQLVQKSSALLGVNAGFFDWAMKPLGLLIRDGKELNPLRSVSWWGIFSVDQNNIARIEALKEFKKSSRLQIAIQAGPRLVDGGKVVPGLKSNVSAKTFVAQTSASEIILGVTQKGVLDSNELAQILVKDIQVQEALCFDGGSSTQLYAKIKGQEKEVFGLASVVSAVGVMAQ